MPRRLEMTWVPARHGWMKKHQGKMYSVSCRQLGMVGMNATMEASRALANQWWQDKLAELERPGEEAIAEIVDAAGVLAREKLETAIMPAIDAALETILQQYAASNIDAAIPHVQAHLLKLIVKASNALKPVAAVEPAATLGTVGTHVARFQERLRLNVATGKIDHSRYSSYCRDLDAFVAWFGAEKPMTSINEATVDAYYAFIMAHVVSGQWSSSYAVNKFGAFRLFVTRSAEKRLIPMPCNIRSTDYRIKMEVKTPMTFTIQEIKTLLEGCQRHGERMKLYILLCLNCGMYQTDIAELRQDQVDWQHATITRARSKTESRGGQVVTYKLWNETFTLLQKHRAKTGSLVLLTERGKPVVQEHIRADGGLSRTDTIKSAYNRLCGRLKIATKPLKCLRKTGATILESHLGYNYYVNYYLGHSPRSQKEQHFSLPNNQEFFAALAWLREQILETPVLA